MLTPFLFFVSIGAFPSFMMKRSIFEKDILNKLYHLILYQLVIGVTSWLVVLIITIVSTILDELMANLNGLGILFVDLFFSLLIAEGIVSLVAILIPHYIIGRGLVAGMYSMFMLCEGFIAVNNDNPPWIRLGSH